MAAGAAPDGVKVGEGVPVGPNVAPGATDVVEGPAEGAPSVGGGYADGDGADTGPG